MWKKFITAFSGLPWPLKILLVGLLILLPLWFILPIALKIAQNPQQWSLKLKGMFSRLDPITAARLRIFSEAWNIPYDWLIKVIKLETAGTFDPLIVNQTTKAKGLFQIIPSTAEYIGYPVPDDGASQVKMFADYLRLNGFSPGQIKSESDLYLSIFYPAAVGKPDDFVLGNYKLSPSLIARQNKGFDLNGNQQITVGEIKKYLEDF